MERGKIRKNRKKGTMALSCLFGFLMAGLSLSAQSVDSLLENAYRLDMSAPEQAKQSALEAYGMGQEAKDEAVCAKALASYAWVVMVEGDFEMSLGVYRNALEYCPDDSLHIKADIYNGIGWVYTRLDNFPDAAFYIRRSIRLYEDLRFPEGLASAYNNYGLNYYYSGDYHAADSCFNIAMQIAREIGNEKYIAAITNNLCMSPGNSLEKIAMLEEAIRINTSLNVVWSLAENYNNLGRQYYFLDRYDEALVALEKAESFAWKVEAQDLLYENYALRTKIHAKRKDYAMAYACTQKQLDINRSIQSERSFRRLENSFSHKKLLNLEQEYAMRQQEHRMAIRQRNYILLFIVLMFCMGGLYARQRFLRKKKEMEVLSQQMELEQSHRKIMELELKRQEETITGVSNRLQETEGKLAYTLMFVRYRNELLEKIREKIRETYKLKTQEVLVELKKINMFIGQNEVSIEDDELFKEVDARNAAFCVRLDTQYPGMTSKGRELAVFLRMGLSVREISMITGNSIKTLNMNRYRLRKHLGLSPEEDLVELLKRI